MEDREFSWAYYDHNESPLTEQVDLTGQYQPWELFQSLTTLEYVPKLVGKEYE